MDNTWITILEQWRIREMGFNGCTLPFLTAIYTVDDPPKMPDEGEVEEILNYLFENKTAGEKYWIRNCRPLGWVIVQKIDTSNPYEPDEDAEPATWYTDFLLIEDSILGFHGTEKADLINGLKSESNDKILNGNYSKNDGKWGDYSPEEKKFIKGIISK